MTRACVCSQMLNFKPGNTIWHTPINAAVNALLAWHQLAQHKAYNSKHARA